MATSDSRSCSAKACDQDRFQMPELATFEYIDIGVHIQPVAAAGDFDFFREASAHM